MLVNLNKRAMAELELLRRVQGSVELLRVVREMADVRDNCAYQAQHAPKHLRSEYKRRSEFYANLAELLGGGG